MRVVSLLPAATELVCALGGRALLVGRSHECDFPDGLDDVPVLSRARVDGFAPGPVIDREVRSLLARALSIYQLDLDGLARAAPDLVVTQDLCAVCAVPADEVRDALRAVVPGARLIALSPRRLDDVWDDLRRIGAAIDRPAAPVIDASTSRLAELRARFAGAPRPRVLTLEWLDPPMVGGLWMPELIEAAGGDALACAVAEHARTLDDDALAALDPDVVIVKPCGWPLAITRREVAAVRARIAPRWRAAVFLADGNAFFNRPGPRLVDSAEIIAACLHGDAAADLAARHRDGFELL